RVRVPAMNLDAEAALLGGVLLGGVEVLRTLGPLPTSAFAMEAHREIWTAIERLDARGEPISAITVQADVARWGDLAVSGGAEKLALLMEAGSVEVHAPTYARIVAETAVLREYEQLSRQLATATGSDPADRATLVEAAQGRIRALELSAGASRLRLVSWR